MDAPTPDPISITNTAFLEVVAAWRLADGADVRLVRYALRGAARQLVMWGRGDDYAPHQPDIDGGEWLAGVSLEEREHSGARWQVIRRQELATDDLDAVLRRLGGWTDGLIAHAEKRARRRAAGRDEEE